ncbi:MAG: hypothetical protein COX96_04515 [Candidatus Omnitrophica bacterium CG_4_10_14_0_2_um_filter_44_9]|nr:MAG: hypothetical protein COY78_06870 [Candidatus Omnitrophica bacterium CG_4_10_14_0_8_um_filter_44_12]PIZ84306.1 MAG: hypothetical protein COX96_04515 [Candidatus Omnitrophica bacterium CG_4_10_14_0_2_um_filter_44_9]
MKKILESFLVVSLFVCCMAQAEAQTDPMAQAKAFYIQQHYWQAIQECGEVINKNSGNSDILSEANYFTGASYANLFDFLTAKKNFATIVEKYKGTKYYEDAYMGLGDVELFGENLYEALKVYTGFYITNPSKKRLATLYFRLSEVNLKLGNKTEYKKYLQKLQSEFPLSFEARDSMRLSGHDVYYTCQVGAFTNYDNAEKFIAGLKIKGYEVYSVLCMLSDKKLCRVRIGKFKTLAEAESLKQKLEKDGYLVKIFP